MLTFLLDSSPSLSLLSTVLLLHTTHPTFPKLHTSKTNRDNSADKPKRKNFQRLLAHFSQTSYLPPTLYLHLPPPRLPPPHAFLDSQKGPMSTTLDHVSSKLNSLPLHPSTTTPLTPPLSPKRSLSPERPKPTPRTRYSPPTTDYLNQQPRTRLTPAIGVQFEREFQLKDVLALPDGEERKEGLLRELAYQSECTLFLDEE